jgi:hypothetical protein
VPDLSAEVSGENGLELRAGSLEKLTNLVSVHRAEIEISRRRGRFPFVAHGQSTTGRLGGFYGE